MADATAVQREFAKPRWRWSRRLLFLAIATCAIACFHGRILRSVAEFLVVDEPRIAADAVLMVGGESQFDAAAELYENGAKVVFLRRSPPGRLERLGILRSAEDSTRRELVRRGIREDDLTPLSDGPVENSRVGALLCDWLRTHPEHQIALLCDRFSTRKWQLIVRRSADSDLVSRIRWVALPHRSFDETNWWHSKSGLRTILNGYLRLGFTWWHAGPQAPGRECSAADFESAFARKARP